MMASNRRRTPDHPPYALMIGAAIRSLTEEGGSTEESISRFIRSNYDGIPWGHDRLLPYYLNKLTLEAELVSVTPGRYDIVPQQDQQEGEEGKFDDDDDDEDDSDIEEGWPIHCEGDLVKWVQAFSPTGPKPIEEVGEHQKKPKRRGRPLKKMRPTETVGPMDDSLTIEREPMDLQVDNVEPPDKYPQEKQKRRERPPKKKQKQQDHPQESGRRDGSPLTSSEPMGMKTDGFEPEICPQERPVEVVKLQAELKKRGRSPKRQQHELQHKGATGPTKGGGGDGPSAISSEPMGLKGNDNEPNNELKNIVLVERRRRPPKTKSRLPMINGKDGSDEGAGDVERGSAAAPPKTSHKRCGRPPKPKAQVLDS